MYTTDPVESSLAAPDRYIGIGATAATTTACVMLLVLMGLDSRRDQGAVIHRQVGPLSLASAFGTMLYSYGGHAMFPTFQTDMKDPRKFGKACKVAYLSKGDAVCFAYDVREEERRGEERRGEGRGGGEGRREEKRREEKRKEIIIHSFIHIK